MWYEIIYPFPNFNGLINSNNSAMIQIMAWRQTSDNPLSEPMMTKFNSCSRMSCRSVIWSSMVSKTVCGLLEATPLWELIKVCFGLYPFILFLSGKSHEPTCNKMLWFYSIQWPLDKWLTFPIQHFQMQFLKTFVWYFYWNFPEFCAWGFPIEDRSSLV